MIIHYDIKIYISYIVIMFCCDYNQLLDMYNNFYTYINKSQMDTKKNETVVRGHYSNDESFIIV